MISPRALDENHFVEESLALLWVHYCKNMWYHTINEYVMFKNTQFYIDFNVNQSATWAKFYHRSTNTIIAFFMLLNEKVSQAMNILCM